MAPNNGTDFQTEQELALIRRRLQDAERARKDLAQASAFLENKVRDTSDLLERLTEEVASVRRELPEKVYGGSAVHIGRTAREDHERIIQVEHELATLRDKRMPRNAQTSTTEGHIHRIGLMFDEVIGPGGDLAGAFASRGAKSVFLLNGTYTLTASFTVPADGYLVGETRDGVVVTTGAFLITMNGTMERLTISGATHASGGAAAVAGRIADVLFDNCETSTSCTSGGTVINCRFTNFVGDATDAYCKVALAAYSVINCYFALGPGILGGGFPLYGSISGNSFFMPADATRPSLYIGASSLCQGNVITGNTFITNQSGGAPSSDAGHLRLGGAATFNTISGNSFVNSAGIAVYGVRVDASDNNITGNIMRGATTGIDIRASKTVIANNILDGSGGTNGILISGNYDNNIITGNEIRSFTTGINISSTSAESNIVTQNNVADNTTPITDNGSGTVLRDNITVLSTGAPGGSGLEPGVGQVLTGISTAETENLTIGATNGDIAPAKQHVIVAANGGSGTDNLDRIDITNIPSVGAPAGAVFYARAAAGSTIVVRHNRNAGQVYNIQVPGDADVTIPQEGVMLFVYDGTVDTNGAWVPVAWGLSEADISHANIAGVLPDDHHPQVHTIFSHDTTASGAELDTLTGGGNADTLHTHAAGAAAGEVHIVFTRNQSL